VGVEHRVEELADREAGYRPENAKPFESLASLPEVLGACMGCSPESKKVHAEYERLLRTLGPEMTILRELSGDAIQKAGGSLLAEGIRRLRCGQVERQAGYDGLYGKVSLFAPSELETLKGQTVLFTLAEEPRKKQRAEHPAEPAAMAEPAVSAFQDTLNPEQLAAATAQAGTVAVSAGPGTGKTKTLVARIAWLIRERGVKPTEITAVTFTNQAAGELRSRIEAALGGKTKAKGITIGTFHAIARELLPKKTLLGEREGRELLSAILTKYDPKLTPKKAMELISAAKRGEVALSAAEAVLCDAYHAELQACNARDLDDLLLDALKLDVSKEKRFRHILVDEFQDLDPIQHKLIAKWSEGCESLFAIGDADQSIYGFRGADAACFEKLREAHPDLVEITLKENYRFTPEILAAAMESISHNRGKNRMLHANRGSGAPVRAIKADNAFSQAVFIAKEIARMTGGFDMASASKGERERDVIRPFSEIAVLARTRRELMLIESCLKHDSIPSVIYGHEDAFEEGLARGALCFFRSLLEPKDAYSFTEALRLLWDCPADLREKAVRTVAAQTTWDVEMLRNELSPYAHFDGWLAALESFLPVLKKEKPGKLMARFQKLFDADEFLRKLGNAAAFYDSLPEFLDAITLGQEADMRISSGKPCTGGAVQLMTLHGAKGLEFPAVFLAGVDRGGLPLERAGEECDLEEERRLFFVGMTRAKEELILTYTDPSLFLGEIDGYVYYEKSTSHRRPAEGEQLSLF